MKRLVLISFLYMLLALVLALVAIAGNARNEQEFSQHSTRIHDADLARLPRLGRDLLPPVPIRTITPDPNTSPSYASVKQALSNTDESKKLRGLALKNWYGWITNIEKIETSYRIRVAIDNPFTGESTLNVVLDGYQEKPRNVRLGHMVKFSGAIDTAWANSSDSIAGINMRNAEIEPIHEMVPELLNQPLPARLEVRLERTPGYFGCCGYELKIQGDGTIILSKDNELPDVPMLTVPLTVPVQTSAISHEKMAELLALFRQVDYTSLKDSYETEGWTDSSSANTSITIDGKAKAVAHYHGDPSAPVRLTLLEDMIDEIVNTKQWLKDN